MIQGKPLDTLLGEEAAGFGAEPEGTGPLAAGVFCGGEVVGVIEKKARSGGGAGLTYGYVYARTAAPGL
jgi:hypothetical protein